MATFTTILCPVHDSKKCPCKTSTSTFSLFSAAQFNDVDTVRGTLTKFPHKANMQDDYGYSPLHYAAQSGALQAVAVLLAGGAHVDGAPEGGCGATPLHRAAFAGRTQVCKVLLERGASVDALDSSFGDMRTPLLKAASEGHVSIIEMLLDRGADVHVTDAQGLGLLDLCTTSVLQELMPHLPETIRDQASQRIEANAPSLSTLVPDDPAPTVEAKSFDNRSSDEQPTQPSTEIAEPKPSTSSTIKLGLVCSTCGEVLLVGLRRAGKMYCSLCYSAVKTQKA